jgi:AraC family transcriptional regulator
MPSPGRLEPEVRAARLGTKELDVIEFDGHGAQKYPVADVATSSAARGWTGIAAEVRRHSPGELASIRLAHMEVAIATRRAQQARVSRKGDGVRQDTQVQPGTIWLCPVGVCEDNVVITAPIEVLHLYLPAHRFDQLSEVCGGTAIKADSIRYLAGVNDALVRQVGVSLLDELRSPTAAGKVLVESLALVLTARLAQTYALDRPRLIDQSYRRHGMDEIRLRRVLDFMAEHLDENIGINELAAVACLSPFHFIRMFKNRLNMPPHRYLGELRLERAKSLLALGDTPLCEVALACGFASQTNFTRAFRLAIGVPPGKYRNGSN